MIVSDAITLLQNAELKQLKIKDDKPAVLGFINLGILELHKRFRLWESSAVVTPVDGTTLYTLDGIDANVAIDLTGHEILTIDCITDQDDLIVHVDDDAQPTGVKNLKYNELTVTYEEDLVLTVKYRATPSFLLHEKETIPVPPQFYEALFHYVGYRGHGSLKGDEKDENNTHYKRFEKSCNQIKREGLYIEDNLDSTKFTDRGFV